MIRAFVAVELTDVLRRALGLLQAQVKAELARELRRTAPDARLQWVRPEAIHLTLKFLGDIAEEQVDEIAQALTAVAGSRPRFFLEVGGLGVFPDARAPRVLWVGLCGAEPVISLARAVDEALGELNFAPESRAFNPHLTLARIKERGREVGKALAALGLLAQASPLGTLPVRTVALMRSELKPSGSVYTRLREVPLRDSG
jgi:2'-5' RNA ligase